jgi:hypothetical protein
MQPPLEMTEKMVSDQFFFTALSLVGNVGFACVLIVILNMLLYRFKGKLAPSTKVPNLILGLLALFLFWYFTFMPWGIKTIPTNGYPSFIGIPASLLILLPLLYVLGPYFSFLAFVFGSKDYLSGWERCLFIIGLVLFPLHLALWQVQADVPLPNITNSEVNSFANLMGSVFFRAVALLSLSLIAYMTWTLHMRMKQQESKPQETS